MKPKNVIITPKVITKDDKEQSLTAYHFTTSRLGIMLWTKDVKVKADNFSHFFSWSGYNVLITALLMFFCLGGFAQVTPKCVPPILFYVENSTGIGSPVLDELTKLGCTITYCKEKATYIVYEEIHKHQADEVRLSIVNNLNQQVLALSEWHCHLWNVYTAVEYAAQKDLAKMLLKLWL